MMKNEILLVKELGDQIGYGNLMTIASAIWRKKLKDSGTPVSGAFVPTIEYFLNDEGMEIFERERPIYDKLISGHLSNHGGGFQNSDENENSDGMSGFRG